MKKCSRCKTVKACTAFGINKAAKDGLSYYCNTCLKEAHKASNKRLEEKSPGHANQRKREWRKNNPLCGVEAKKEYAKNNPEKQRAWVAKATAKFKEEHPEEYAAKMGEKAMRREAMKAQRTPSWSSPAACRLVYLQRVKLQKATGVRHAVDHSVPLRGKLVSGLHVPENLVVVPFEVNAQKSNKFDPMTYEWWPECCPKPPQTATISPMKTD